MNKGPLNRTVVLSGSQPPGAPPPPAGSVPPAGPAPLGGTLSTNARGGAYRPSPNAHPLMEAMYAACADLLMLASQVGLGAMPPPPGDLRQHLQSLFTTMTARAHAAGISSEDAADASFAIVSLLDELLVQAPWPGKMDWQKAPLQFVYFHENTAGETFFRRAYALLSQPHRAHVLQIYFYCLALGFQGRYAVNALHSMSAGGAGGSAGLAAAYDQIAAALSPYVLPSEPLSPHGEPPDTGRSLLQREAPIVRVSLSIFVLALLVFIGLRVALSAELASTIAPMKSYASAPVPRGGP